jgi:hypothetical protein
MYTIHALCIYVFRMTDITNSYNLSNSIDKLIFVRETDCMELDLLYICVQAVLSSRSRDRTPGHSHCETVTRCFSGTTNDLDSSQLISNFQVFWRRDAGPLGE